VDGVAAAGSDAVSGSLDADAAFVAGVQGEMARLRRVARVLVGDPQLADDLVGGAIARTLSRWRAGKVGDIGAYMRQIVWVTSRRSSGVVLCRPVR